MWPTTSSQMLGFWNHSNSLCGYLPLGYSLGPYHVRATPSCLPTPMGDPVWIQMASHTLLWLKGQHLQHVLFLWQLLRLYVERYGLPKIRHVRHWHKCQQSKLFWYRFFDLWWWTGPLLSWSMECCSLTLFLNSLVNIPSCLLCPRPMGMYGGLTDKPQVGLGSALFGAIVWSPQKHPLNLFQVKIQRSLHSGCASRMSHTSWLIGSCNRGLGFHNWRLPGPSLAERKWNRFRMRRVWKWWRWRNTMEKHKCQCLTIPIKCLIIGCI